jgi:two-component system KDP operon response regulator KdpE
MIEDSYKNRMVLVVDDEDRMVRFIRLNLEHDGFQVIEAGKGMQAVNIIREKLPDIVLLDVMLPDIDGYEVLKLIRQHNATPVIMLTARGEEEDRIKGLELGADDYITKPFSPRELVSRIKAVLRRSETGGIASKEVIRVDNRLTMDFGRHEILVDGKPVQLRPTEYRLLYHLAMNAGWVQTYDTLLAKVWGYEYQDEPHYVRLYVNYLRQKLEKDPANPIYILTERGVGYRFVDYRKNKQEANI